MNDKLTVKEAYLAMFEYLEQLYFRTNSDDLGGFLGGMTMEEDGDTMDSAAWNDWLKAVENILKNN